MNKTQKNFTSKVLREIKGKELDKVSGGDFDIPVDDYNINPEKPTPVKRKPKRS
ncbi:hypothetical protein [Aliiglaciecola lipolytica]|uniref:Uncharacterized protein n=1 Tax=Aliiglaciecola lipolytica E3 TaxID=1127673 RepID=K6XX07_9ALTE|nr:hypothetical protein [Aliiglaciecola lipolytica]GAC16186.1 hypothetical protein GLIP_3575 [Aliiglaciecola lipolytica E3]